MRLKRRVGGEEWGVDGQLGSRSWCWADAPPLIDKRKRAGRVQAPRRDTPVGWKQAHPARPGRAPHKKRGPGK